MFVPVKRLIVLSLVVAWLFSGCSQEPLVAVYSSEDGLLKISVFDPTTCDFARQITFKANVGSTEHGPFELEILNCGLAFSKKDFVITESPEWILFRSIDETQSVDEKVLFACEKKTGAVFSQATGFPDDVNSLVPLTAANVKLFNGN